MTERIERPAVLLDDRVHTMEVVSTHGDILRKLGVTALSGVQGFVTSTGRFVNRYDACGIARASRQLVKDYPGKSELYTGDWK